MKKSLFLAAGLVLGLTAGAQKIKETEVPQAVRDAFKSSHKAVKAVKWEKEKENFEAGFKMAGKEQSVVYDQSGKLLETEVEIKVEELPATIKDYVSKNYPKSKIQEASKMTDANGAVTYEAEIKGKDLIFDSTGKFVKEEVEQDEDKD